MNRNSIRWRLPASYAVIALLAALSLGSVMMLVLRSYDVQQEREYLLGNALALRPVLEKMLEYETRGQALQDKIRLLSFLSRTQIRLLDLNGNAIADSGIPEPKQVVAVSGSPGVIDKKTFTQTINEAPGPASVFIYSSRGGELPPVPPSGETVHPGEPGDMLVTISASPYGYQFVSQVDGDPSRRSSQVVTVQLTSREGFALGMLEFSNGPSYGAAVIRSVSLAWLIASVFAIAIAALAGWYASQRVTRPVLALEHATQEMARGDLSVRVNLPKENQQEFLSLAHSFNGMAEQVEQMVSTLRAFVADAAHELHTPLTALQTNLELAREEENAARRSRYLERAQEQGRRLEALVKGLLDLSRIEAAIPASDFAPVDLARLVREAGEQFASRAEQAEREFKLSIGDEPASVNGNEDQLRQVLTNLLENALKFTPRNGSVSVNLEHAGHEIRLTVADTGIGIPPEDLPRVFERFHRGRNASAYPGNGLGLAIVKAIVDAHGGSVAIRSQPGQGTSITVTLPMREAPVDGIEGS